MDRLQYNLEVGRNTQIYNAKAYIFLKKKHTTFKNLLRYIKNVWWGFFSSENKWVFLYQNRGENYPFDY